MFPVVGARLRLLRENFPDASLVTEIVRADETDVIMRATCKAGDRLATAIGTSSAVGDRALQDSLYELAETRAIARCLRFFGLGLDATGAEEVVGRKPLSERDAPSLPPVRAAGVTGDITEAQRAHIRKLVTEVRAKGIDIRDLAPAETGQDAADLIEAIEARLKGGT